MKNKKLIIISLAIISIILIYNIFTTYQSEARLSNYIMDDAKTDIFRATMYIDEANTILKTSVESQSLNYEDVERLQWVNKEIDYYAGRILDKQKALMSEEYVERKMQRTSNPTVISQDIERYYNSFLTGFRNREEDLELDENYIQNIEMIIDAYSFYDNTLSHISKKINLNQRDWIEELTNIYHLIIEMFM